MIWATLVLVVLILSALCALLTRMFQTQLENQRVEIQKLTAALISKENAVSAAVYMSHDPAPARSTEEILEDRAQEKADWKPMGL